MTSNKFFKSLLAISLSSALLVTGCRSSQEDTVLSTEPTQSTESAQSTENTSSTTEPLQNDDTSEATAAPLQLGDRVGGCFVAPDPETRADFVELYSSYDCVPSYLYFKKHVYGEPMLLLAKECKFIAYETANTAWVASKDNEFLKVNKFDGSYEVLYRAQNGEISGCLNSYRDGEYKGRLLYIQDGSCIVQMDRETGEYTIPVRSDNGISWYAGVGAIENSKAYHEDAYICEECGYDGDYILWADDDDNYFWYHPETGENERVLMGAGMNLYFLQANE